MDFTASQSHKTDDLFHAFYTQSVDGFFFTFIIQHFWANKKDEKCANK